MSRMYTEDDSIFDGFAHRQFNPDMDGWRNSLPDSKKYSCVEHALSVIDMFDELCAARKKIWELEQELKLWKPIAMQSITG